VRSEIESNKSTDSIESIGSENKQELHQLKDSTAEPLQWHRASKDSPIAQNLDQLLKIMGHTVVTYGKNVEKQLKTMKRFQ
jgi:hypothetical protein